MRDAGVRVGGIQKWEAANSFPQQVNYTVGGDNSGLHINIISPYLVIDAKDGYICNGRLPFWRLTYCLSGIT